MIDPKYQSTHMAVSKSAMETMEKMVKQLQAERDMLFDKMKMIAAIEDQMHGPDWEEIDEARDIAELAIEACTDSTKVLE